MRNEPDFKGYKCATVAHLGGLRERAERVRGMNPYYLFLIVHRPWPRMWSAARIARNL